MAYQKYQTEALILHHTDYGESDRIFTLYTSEFGLIRARASNVRGERSKMRHALYTASRAHIGLVRGKRGWRIAGATAAASIASADVNGIRAFARLGLLVERLLVIDERNDALFAVLSEAHTALVKPGVPQWAVIELLSVARILYVLGYLSVEGLGAALITAAAYSEQHVREADAIRGKLLESVNRAIAETQL